MSDRVVLDFSEPAIKRMHIGYIRSLEGLHWVEVHKCRDQRTNAQNAYFHGVMLPLIAPRISDLWGEKWDTERTKEYLKDEFLRRAVVNKDTGEIRGYYTEHTHKLNTAEMCDFIDKVILFCGEQLDLEIPSPSRHREEHPCS